MSDLSGQASYWKETGASEFVISVIENGHVPQLWDNPEKYEEENNKSYKNERDWANNAVRKLREAKLLREVRFSGKKERNNGREGLYRKVL